VSLIAIGGSGRRLKPVEQSPVRFSEEGKRWANQQGFPPLAEELYVEAGLSVALYGTHLPDLAIDFCERLGLAYEVKTRKQKLKDFTYLRRTVIVQPPVTEEPPEPPPPPEKAQARREWGKARSERIEVRFSQVEVAELDAAAAKQGISRSEYLRKLAWSDENAGRAWRGEPVDQSWLREMQEKVAAIKQRVPFKPRDSRPTKP
jgi:Mobilization protein NikA